MIAPFTVDETGVPETSRCAYEKQALQHKKKKKVMQRIPCYLGVEHSLLVISDNALPPF